MPVSLFQKLKTSLKFLNSPRVLKALLSQYHSGYLLDEGWFKSFKIKAPVNILNDPIPWLSYPCIDFLDERLHKNLSIFEFGSGNSTIYFSSKVRKVTSVEHNLRWYEKVKTKIPENVNLLYKNFRPDGEYAQSIRLENEEFDIIIIDGMDRVRAIKYSMGKLSPVGIIILDDSERIEYVEGIEFILSEGFKRIDFWGIAPVVLHKKCTTIFYKSNNCLGI